MASDSQSVLASIGDDQADGDAQADTSPWTAVFIVASPRPATGKTFLARLVTDFLCSDGGPVEAFELSPGDVALSDRLPELTTELHLDGTREQMKLFDRLILADGVAKVIDLGHESFQRFFGLVEKIGFAREAQRAALDVIVLYAADAHVNSMKAYSILQRRLPEIVLVPVFNEGIIKGHRLRDEYPFTRAAAVPLHIPLLPPALKTHAERSGYRFVDTHETDTNEQTPDAASGPDFELDSWTRRTFLEFREFALRLLMEKLRTSLKE